MPSHVRLRKQELTHPILQMSRNGSNSSICRCTPDSEPKRACGQYGFSTNRVQDFWWQLQQVCLIGIHDWETSRLQKGYTAPCC
jgi:hypothetical protein